MKIEYVQQQHQTLLNYLRLCVSKGDWHAVRDAAVDVEILEARYPALRQCERSGSRTEYEVQMSHLESQARKRGTKRRRPR